MPDDVEPVDVAPAEAELPEAASFDVVAAVPDLAEHDAITMARAVAATTFGTALPIDFRFQ